MNSWNVIAAVNGSQSGKSAESMANVKVFVNGIKNPSSMTVAGPISLERFGYSTLTRIVVHHSDEAGRNKAVLCLPPDCKWAASVLKKVKGKRSGMKGVESIVELPKGHKEGYNFLKITMPYDGDEGSAMLFGGALVFASQAVVDYVTS